MGLIARLVNTLTFLRGTRKIQFGEVESPYEKALDEESVALYIEIAASGTAELFDGAETDPFATAKMIWVASDRDCVLQLTFDTAGQYGKEVITLAVEGSGEAGVMGPPTQLPLAQAYANYTEDFADGTLVYCDRVTIKNTDSSNAAYVEAFIGKQA